MLAARLAEMLVVENENAKVLRRLVGDNAERADAHHHLAVAGNREDAALGLRERNAQCRGYGKAHATPRVEILGLIAGGGDVPCRAAETRHDESVATVLEKLRD